MGWVVAATLWAGLQGAAATAALGGQERDSALPITVEQVRRDLDKDELDYPALAARYGESALAELRAIVAQDEPRLASKAAYLAGVIGGGLSHEVVALAAESRHATSRVSAAAAAAALPAARAAPIASRLLRDGDPGVRVEAARSAARIGGPALREELLRMAAQDPEPYARNLAAELARQIAPP